MSEKNLKELKQLMFLSTIEHTPRKIHDALIYLKDCQNSDGGWGHYSNLPTHYYTSFLAIKALRISEEAQFKAIAEEASLGLRTKIFENIEQLKSQELIDSLIVVSGIKSEDSELEKILIYRTMEVLKDAYLFRSVFSFISIHELILVLSKNRDITDEFIKSNVNLIIESQDPITGGWSANFESKSELIPTCKALSILNQFPNEVPIKSITRALAFLEKYFNNAKWEGTLNVFTVSIIMQTIGEMENAPIDIVQSCVDFLYGLQNTDNGWSAQREKISDIEHTALSIIALISCGENKFVPYNLVKASYAEVETEIIGLRKEKTKFLNNVDQRVNEEIPKIIQDRIKLTEEIQNYKHKVNKAQSEWENLLSALKELENKNKESELRIKTLLAEKEKLLAETREKDAQLRDDLFYKKEKNLSRTRKTFLVLSGTLVLLLFTSICIRYFSSFMIENDLSQVTLSNNANIVFFISILLGMIAVIRYYFDNIGNKTRRLNLKKESSYLNYKLYSILNLWPLSKREEFLFYLRKRSDLNFDNNETLMNFIEDIKYTYGVNKFEKGELENFILLYAKISISERLRLIDDIKESFNYEKEY